MSKGHTGRAHARLSASGSHRWMACPGSVRLEATIPDKSTSYSAEGTLAHEVAELKLRLALGLITKRKFSFAKKKLGDIPVEMDRYTDNYVDLVLERINEARAVTKDAEVLLEQRLDFSNYVPEGFGTGDVVIVADGVLQVIDLKYGFMEVLAENNSQLRLYGLGALNEFDCLYDIQTVKTSIIQPRIDNFSTEEIPADELIQYGAETIKPAADSAASGKGELNPGNHCMFCKAKATCRARAEANLALVSEEFNEPELLTNEELADIFGKVKEFESWVSDIKEYTLDQAINHGEKYPGYKLVEGRSKRAYADEAKVAETLLSVGRKENEIYTPRKLLGLTAMNKLLGKSLPEILGELLIRTPGKPTLVPESDKRPELSSTASAEADFKDTNFD